jgi:hypothetical protein
MTTEDPITAAARIIDEALDADLLDKIEKAIVVVQDLLVSLRAERDRLARVGG